MPSRPADLTASLDRVASGADLRPRSRRASPARSWRGRASEVETAATCSSVPRARRWTRWMAASPTAMRCAGRKVEVARGDLSTPAGTEAVAPRTTSPPLAFIAGGGRGGKDGNRSDRRIGVGRRARGAGARIDLRAGGRGGVHRVGGSFSVLPPIPRRHAACGAGAPGAGGADGVTILDLRPTPAGASRQSIGVSDAPTSTDRRASASLGPQRAGSVEAIMGSTRSAPPGPRAVELRDGSTHEATLTPEPGSSSPSRRRAERWCAG